MNKEEEYFESEWSDEILKKIASSRKFPQEVFNIDEIKPIICRFFHFYFTGDVTSDCSVQCTIFSAIALLNVQFSKGYSRVFATGKHFVADKLKERPLFYKPHHHSDQNYFHKTSDKNKDLFRDEVRNILLGWETTTIDEQATLMRLAAFLALKFCVATVKNSHQLMSHFDDSDYSRKVLHVTVDWGMNRNYSKPNLNSINKCVEILNQSSNRLSLRSIYSIVVQKWISVIRINSKENRISLLLMNSLLEETAGNGIGLINLMTSVMFCMNVTFDQILNALKAETKQFPQYEESWNRLAEFKEKFADESNLELSYPWGRLIKPASLKKYSAKENVFLCSVFATIVEIYEGPQVWNSFWIKTSDSGNLQAARKVGGKIHDILLEKSLASSK